MNTYLIRFKTKPSMASENFGRFAGAAWNILITGSDTDTCLDRAIDYVQKQGWDFDDGAPHADICGVKREMCSDDKHLLERFDEAQKSGIAATLHTFKTTIAETN